MTRSAPPVRLSRRLMMSSLISAATLTPMSMISHANSVSPSPASSLSSRTLARWPVRKTSRSAMAGEFGVAPSDRGFEIGKRLDHLGPLEALQLVGVLQVDPARIDLDQAVRRHGFEFRRGVAGKDNRRH